MAMLNNQMVSRFSRNDGFIHKGRKKNNQNHLQKIQNRVDFKRSHFQQNHKTCYIVCNMFTTNSSHQTNDPRGGRHMFAIVCVYMFWAAWFQTPTTSK